MPTVLARLYMVFLVVIILTIMNCGGGGKGVESPVLTTYGKDSLAVRNILDANGLQSIEVGGALSPLNNEGTRIGELNLQGKNLTVIPKDIGQLTYSIATGFKCHFVPSAGNRKLRCAPAHVRGPEQVDRSSIGNRKVEIVDEP